jgi:hypothetical protein
MSTSPYALPSNPFDSADPTTAVQEAIALHVAATKATDVLGIAYSGAREARDAITAAQHALDAAIQESATTGKPHKDEVKLAKAIQDAQDAADPAIHNRRIAIAVQAQREAVGRYHAYVRDNLPALLDTFRPEAHAAAEAVAEALAQTAPVRQRRDEIAGRVTSLISIGRATPMTHGIDLSIDQAAEWQIDQDEQSAPLPRDSVVDFYYPEVAPEPMPEVELAATDGTWSGW